jgi:hypothetical protein
LLHAGTDCVLVLVLVLVLVWMQPATSVTCNA